MISHEEKWEKKKIRDNKQTKKGKIEWNKRSVLFVLNVLKQDSKTQNKNCIDALMIFKDELKNIISCGSNQWFLFPLHERHAQSWEKRLFCRYLNEL